MEIVWTVIIVISIDALLGYAYKKYKKKQLKRDEDLFIFKFNQLVNQNKLEEAKTLCRMTEGKIPAGCYIALDSIEKLKK